MSHKPHSGQLQKPTGQSGLDKHANQAGKYVIIGGGYAAVLNHLTLMRTDWGRKRLGKMQVIHIYQKEQKQGEVDPWQRHCDHLMGQWPDLLILPGFDVQLSGKAPRKEYWVPEPADWTTFQLSTEFADVTTTHFKQLTKLSRKCRKGAPEPEFQAGRVDRIDSEGQDKYKLTVFDENSEQCHTIVADYIDICTGPGRMNRLGRAKSLNKMDRYEVHIPDNGIWEEYNNIDVNPSPYKPETRRMMPAEMFMHMKLKLSGMAKGGRLCVSGGGALSASCVERAIQWEFEEVLWIVSSRINGAFPAMGRYDHLGTHYGDKLPYRHWDLPETFDKQGLETGYNIRPRYPQGKQKTKVLFAEGYRLKAIQEGKNRCLAVTFRKNGQLQRVMDRDGPSPLYDKLLTDPYPFNCVVVSAQAENKVEHKGSPDRLIPNIVNFEEKKPKDQTPRHELVAIQVGSERSPSWGVQKTALGLRTKDDRVRLLGPTGLLLLTGGPRRTPKNIVNEEMTPRNYLERWWRSLPAQAIVPGYVGITLAALTIVHANGFFLKKKKRLSQYGRLVRS